MYCGFYVKFDQLIIIRCRPTRLQSTNSSQQCTRRSRVLSDLLKFFWRIIVFFLLLVTESTGLPVDHFELHYTVTWSEKNSSVATSMFVIKNNSVQKTSKSDMIWHCFCTYCTKEHRLVFITFQHHHVTQRLPGTTVFEAKPKVLLRPRPRPRPVSRPVLS